MSVTKQIFEEIKNFKVIGQLSMSALSGITCALGFYFQWKIGLSPGVWAIFMISYLLGGAVTTYTMLVDMFSDFELNVDLLMILSAIGAALINSPGEGATLLFLFSFSNALQEFAVKKSGNEIEKLLTLRPDNVNVVRNGLEIELPTSEIDIGETIIVRPGERVPLDGVIEEGESECDLSSLTGESLPVFKQFGDTVLSGSLNINGLLKINVTKRLEESTISQIVKLVEDTKKKKSNKELKLKRLEKYYVRAMLSFVGIVTLAPLIFESISWKDNFYRVITLLVVASPCAVAMSSPVAFLSSLARLAKAGILMKGGSPLEILAKSKIIAMDKTGTLTEGKPFLDKVIPSEDSSEIELLTICASAEAGSEHPLGRCVVESAKNKGIEFLEISEFMAHTGRGIECLINGKTVLVGNTALFDKKGIAISENISTATNNLISESKSMMIVHYDGRFLGVITLGDKLRENVKNILTGLRTKGISEIHMLTGDNEHVANSIANKIGITHIHSSLLPQDKAKIIARLTARGKTLMVGDGINDGPALATADVGIAMGTTGSDLALESADVVLMKDDLSKIKFILDIATLNNRIINQNLIFAFGVIITLSYLTIFHEVPLTVGVAMHEGSTILVALNSLRVLLVNKIRF